jgi:hypothetical protein
MKKNKNKFTKKKEMTKYNRIKKLMYNGKEYKSIPELCEELRRTERTCYNWIKKGKIDCEYYDNDEEKGENIQIKNLNEENKKLMEELNELKKEKITWDKFMEEKEKIIKLKEELNKIYQ